MAKIKCEIWCDSENLYSCQFGGKMGEGARKFLGPDSVLLHTFQSECHVDTMNTYYTYIRGVCGDLRYPRIYTTDIAEDYQPYPEEWVGLTQ